MPKDCPCYREERQHIPSKTDGSTHTATVRWCEHANSPCSREEALNVGGKKLTCEGDKAKCQLPGGYSDSPL